MVVAPSQDAGKGGRAQRSGVHIVELHTTFGQGIRIWGVDRAAAAAEVPKANIKDDEQDLGGTFFVAGWFRPCWFRNVGVASDHEGGKGRIVRPDTFQDWQCLEYCQSCL